MHYTNCLCVIIREDSIFKIFYFLKEEELKVTTFEYNRILRNKLDEMFTSLVVESNTITSLTDMKPIEIAQLRSIFENDFIKMTI